jgi:NAD(P)-dependent dehydrogenase (short-subunit alcohol dehydrogenase family)
MSRLSGKKAVITGGNSGIGAAAAELFIKEGAEVLITGRRKEEVERTVERLGKNAHGLISDAGNMDHVRVLKAGVQKAFPAIDVLFVNAGIAVFTPFADSDEAMFDEQMNINFKGAFHTTRELVPLMKDGGSIILTSSILADLGIAGSTVYSASKAALKSLAKTLAVELATRNIRVNTISPGPINTPIYGKMGMPEDVLTAFAASVQAKIPLNRFGTPEEVAQVALFLASGESSFLTGTDLAVDGGKAMAF